MTAVLLLITGSAVSTESMEYFSFLWSDDVIPVYLSLCYLPLMQLSVAHPSFTLLTSVTEIQGTEVTDSGQIKKKEKSL